MKVLFVGDICISSEIEDTGIAIPVRSLFSRFDYCVGNWEAPIIKNDFRPFTKAGPHIHQHSSYRTLIDALPFTHVSLANNHIMDYGASGLDYTMQTLEKNGMTTFGGGKTYQQAYEPILLTSEDVKLAILGVGEAQFGVSSDEKENKSGYAWINSPDVLHRIIALRQQVDYIIVFAHAGLEMCDLPLPEWRKIYQSFIDFGGDLVIGTHPHVIQGKEIYKGKSIYYSLGNFYFNNNKVQDARWFTSMGLGCSFTSNGVEIEEYFFAVADNVLRLAERNVTFEQLSQELTDENYQTYLEKITQECTQAWQNYYKKYYGYPVFKRKPTNRFLNKLVQKVLNRYLVQPNDLLLYHNIKIETHRYVVERVLKNLYNTY